MFSDLTAVAQRLLLDANVTLFIYEKYYRPTFPTSKLKAAKSKPNSPAFYFVKKLT